MKRVGTAMKRALVIVDHGSRRAEAHDHLERIAAAVREREPDLEVAVAHMELSAPSIGEAIADCVASGADEISLHPLFLVPGRHLAEDIPRLVSEAEAEHPGLRVRILRPLGERPELAQLILASLDAPE